MSCIYLCVFCRDSFLVFFHFTHIITYIFVIMLCIDMGYTRHCVDVFFYFLTSKKVKTKIILVVNSGETKVSTISLGLGLSTVNVVDISYHSFITTH